MQAAELEDQLHGHAIDPGPVLEQLGSVVQWPELRQPGKIVDLLWFVHLQLAVRVRNLMSAARPFFLALKVATGGSFTPVCGRCGSNSAFLTRQSEQRGHFTGHLRGQLRDIVSHIRELVVVFPIAVACLALSLGLVV